MINGLVDWARLARALAFYGSRGFLQCELDWHARPDICALTCPDPDRMYPFVNDHNEDVLVGSAEQSFMQSQWKGYLPAGRYVSITPCFRREDKVSETHKRYFMKVELYASCDANPETALEFAHIAREFMQGETDQHVDLVTTREGYDLEIGGIEVGSYAARQAAGMSWTCGTGLAEPRFTTAHLNAEAGLTPLKNKDLA
jgi:hypothetical protein|nr:hypothetical protein [Neorhizobium tomejilense]